MASNKDADQYIYMVPTGLKEDSDKYHEYMVVILTDSEGVETKLIEQVGSWEVSLDSYATKTYVDDNIATKVDKDENARLITLEEAAKLAALQDSLIKSVNEVHFTVDNEGKLDLKDLAISKIINLQNILNGKVDVQEGYSLVSPTDR
jgi:hypothetical protein